MIFLAVFFYIGIHILNSSLVETKLVLTEEIENVKRLNIGSIIEECFKNGDNIITTEFLDRNKNKDLCSLCSICSINVLVNLTNLENGKSWIFKHGKVLIKKMGFKKGEYFLYTNILDTSTNKTVLGRFNVRT